MNKMLLWQKYRRWAWYRQILGVVGAVGLVGSVASMVSQYGFGLNPCVMCIQQRVALMVMTLMAFLALLLPVRLAWGRYLAAGLTSVPALFGGYIASKQLHLQSLPLHEQPACGAPWTFRLRGQPLFDWYEPIIRGTGACGEVHRVLGIALPLWALLFFVVMLLILWLGVWGAKRVQAA